MRTRSAQAAGGASTLAVTIGIAMTALAQDSPAPARLDPDKIAGLNLTAIPPDAYQEILVAGQIAEVADEIERVRVAARARNGWVMDTYMVRRRL